MINGISTVIFDLDGTLVDTLPDIADAMNHVLAAHGQEVRPPARYQALIGGGVGAMVDRLVPAFDRGCQARLKEEFIRRYGEKLFEQTACYPGMADVVENLHGAGYTLAVFSNKRDALTQRIVRHFFRPGIFKAIRGHADGAPPKPDPAPTRKLLAEIATEPVHSVLIGDTAIDAETARAVGMEFLGVRWGYQRTGTLADAGAIAVFDRAEQIPEWIERYQTRRRIRAATVG